ncbi:cyanophycinase [Anaeroselena agilis]|uniref:Cyanophycinase n=1 Tax=Anaeroselena agilis TaxID=3063788 RepID=A0ABU3P3V8_9FIRM|nr:cyanophycinase [Selenomonadales bacterium 4137-cl]
MPDCRYRTGGGIIGEGTGNLLVIGGNEDKQGDCVILRKFVAMAGGRDAMIAVVTTATEHPDETGEEYRDILTGLGAAGVNVVSVVNRQAANARHSDSEFEKCTGIFFTGGDQLRLTSILGGSEVDAAIRRAYRRGVVIAGTSAGASVMSDTMIVDGSSSETPKKAALSMANGMGLLEEVVIDQHFAQRGRINRLLAAVAQNPHILGVGIDEDTALVISPRRDFEVIGSQTVTVIDGQRVVHSNISESQRYDPLALTNVILHILPSGYGYDLKRRLPHERGQG